MSIKKAGLDLSHQDSTVRPQDDLYRHFNGGWLKSAVIPADRATDGAFITLRIQSEARVREIIESATGSDEATKISNIYASFMAADAVNAKGCSPIAGELAEVDSITSLKDFISTLSSACIETSCGTYNLEVGIGFSIEITIASGVSITISLHPAIFILTFSI